MSERRVAPVTGANRGIGLEVRRQRRGALAPPLSVRTSVKEGAGSIVWLATLPANGATGGVVGERRRLDWETALF
jgi:hypothetical protein